MDLNPRDGMDNNTQNKIKICRVYAPPKHKHGMWVLVDRLWPRGLKKDAIAFDLWLKEIAPSTPLRQWFHQDPQTRWSEFVKKYIHELHTNASLIEPLLDKAQQTPVTLFYAAKDTQHNQALILQAVLNSWPSPPEIESIK